MRDTLARKHSSWPSLLLPLYTRLETEETMDDDQHWASKYTETKTSRECFRPLCLSYQGEYACTIELNIPPVFRYYRTLPPNPLLSQHPRRRKRFCISKDNELGLRFSCFLCPHDAFYLYLSDLCPLSFVNLFYFRLLVYFFRSAGKDDLFVLCHGTGESVWDLMEREGMRGK